MLQYLGHVIIFCVIFRISFGQVSTLDGYRTFVPINIQCVNDQRTGLVCSADYPDQCKERWNFPNPCTPDNIRHNKIRFAHPYDTTKFLMCGDYGKLYVVQCPRNEIYHEGCSQCIGSSAAVTASCEFPVEVTQLVINPCTEQHILANKLFFPFPGNLSKFIHCDIWGKPWERMCTPGEVWSLWDLSCVLPTLLTPCNRPDTRYSHLYSHPCDQNSFIQCDLSGLAYVISCGPGRIFHELSQGCVRVIDYLDIYNGTLFDNYCGWYTFGFETFAGTPEEAALQFASARSLDRQSQDATAINPGLAIEPVQQHTGALGMHPLNEFADSSGKSLTQPHETTNLVNTFGTKVDTNMNTGIHDAGLNQETHTTSRKTSTVTHSVNPVSSGANLDTAVHETVVHRETHTSSRTDNAAGNLVNAIGDKVITDLTNTGLPSGTLHQEIHSVPSKTSTIISSPSTSFDSGIITSVSNKDVHGADIQHKTQTSRKTSTSVHTVEPHTSTHDGLTHPGSLDTNLPGVSTLPLASGLANVEGVRDLRTDRLIPSRTNIDIPAVDTRQILTIERSPAIDNVFRDRTDIQMSNPKSKSSRIVTITSTDTAANGKQLLSENRQLLSTSGDTIPDGSRITFIDTIPTSDVHHVQKDHHGSGIINPSTQTHSSHTVVKTSSIGSGLNTDAALANLNQDAHSFLSGTDRVMGHQPDSGLSLTVTDGAAHFTSDVHHAQKDHHGSGIINPSTQTHSSQTVVKTSTSSIGSDLNTDAALANLNQGVHSFLSGTDGVMGHQPDSGLSLTITDGTGHSGINKNTGHFHGGGESITTTHIQGSTLNLQGDKHLGIHGQGLGVAHYTPHVDRQADLVTGNGLSHGTGHFLSDTGGMMEHVPGSGLSLTPIDGLSTFGPNKNIDHLHGGTNVLTTAHISEPSLGIHGTIDSLGHGVGTDHKSVIDHSAHNSALSPSHSEKTILTSTSVKTSSGHTGHGDQKVTGIHKSTEHVTKEVVHGGGGHPSKSHGTGSTVSKISKETLTVKSHTNTGHGSGISENLLGVDSVSKVGRDSLGNVNLHMKTIDTAGHSTNNIRDSTLADKLGIQGFSTSTGVKGSAQTPDLNSILSVWQRSIQTKNENGNKARRLGRLSLHPSQLRSYLFSDIPYTEPCTAENIVSGRLYFKFIGDPHRYIQCDASGNMYLRVCSTFGRDWFDIYSNTCVDGPVHVDDKLAP